MDSINRQRQKLKKLQERDGQSQNQPSQARQAVDGSGILANQLNSIWDPAALTFIGGCNRMAFRGGEMSTMHENHCLSLIDFR